MANKDFISDEEMAKLENPDFISDDEMAKLEKPSYDWNRAPRDLAKSFTEALPMAGGAVGGVLGAFGGPLGVMAGAGLGAGLGKSAENIIESTFFEEPKTTKQLFVEPAQEILAGATGEGAGFLAGKGIQAAGRIVGEGAEQFAKYISPPKQKANADEIIKAAKELGIEVTPGMLDDSGFVERLESVLAKSPSFLGQKVARDLSQVREGLQKASQSTLDKALIEDPFRIGEKFKSGATAAIGERLDPLAATFDEVRGSTKFMDLNPKSLERISKNIAKADGVASGLSEKAQKYINIIPNLKNADEVKQVMTYLNADINDATGADRIALNQIKEKLARFEENTIMRSAIQAARESGGAIRSSTGQKVGSEIVADLKAARQGYRELAGDVGQVAKDARIGNRVGPYDFMSRVEAIPSERIQDKFFNVDNLKQIQELQRVFPEQFELLKQGKLGDIASSSIDNSLMGQGDFSTQRFLNEVRKLNQGAKEILFDPQQLSKISNIEKVQQTVPRNFNPSGTASEASWQDMLYRNVKDVPTYLMYKGASSNLANQIGQYIERNPKMLDLQNTNPAAFQQFISRLGQLGMQQLSPEQEQKGLYDKDKIMSKVQGSQYAKVLQDAAQKGDQSFAAAHYVMSSNDEKYRQMVEDQEK